MTDTLVHLIRQASKPLAPRPTHFGPRLTTFTDIQAVLFDIYGTLLVSASGDIGGADPSVRGEAFAATMAAMGWDFEGNANQGAVCLRAVIDDHHVQSRAAGTTFPEIDIIEVWRQTCSALVNEGSLSNLPPNADFRRLAIEFETRVNPVWPMPHLLECLQSLKQQGKVMGIVSNAQFFTPLIFPAITGSDLDTLGFAPNLRYYSYMHRNAKPGTELYQMAATDLALSGIRPEQVLYVGNDMRNDIWPAAQVGFRTVLFAGDQRSLRLRYQDADSHQYPKPDALVTDLEQIPTLIRDHA